MTKKSSENQVLNLNTILEDADVSKCDSSVIGGEDSKITNKEEVGSGCIYRIQVNNLYTTICQGPSIFLHFYI